MTPISRVGRERRLRVLEGGVRATTSAAHLALGDRAGALALAAEAIDVLEECAGSGRSGSETATRGG
jgi:16S rRNA G966 N2-methylase RsmD